MKILKWDNPRRVCSIDTLKNKWTYFSPEGNSSSYSTRPTLRRIQYSPESWNKLAFFSTFHNTLHRENFKNSQSFTQNSKSLHRRSNYDFYRLWDFRNLSQISLTCSIVWCTKSVPINPNSRTLNYPMKDLLFRPYKPRKVLCQCWNDNYYWIWTQ